MKFKLLSLFNTIKEAIVIMQLYKEIIILIEINVPIINYNNP